MTLKIKDKKIFERNCILDNFITRKFELQDLFVDKGSGTATLVQSVQCLTSRIFR